MNNLLRKNRSNRLKSLPFRKNKTTNESSLLKRDRQLSEGKKSWCRKIFININNISRVHYKLGEGEAEEEVLGVRDTE